MKKTIKLKHRMMSAVLLGSMLVCGILTGTSTAHAGYFDELEATKARMHELAETARAAGCTEDSRDILDAKKIWHEAQAKIDEQLDMLARVVYFEAGSNWLSDRHQQLVACVLLNRCADERFPDTIKENVYRQGQYACANALYTVSKDQIPERCYENARLAAYGMVECNDNVIFQAQFKQGRGTYEKHYNTWFCYG